MARRELDLCVVGLLNAFYLIMGWLTKDWRNRFFSAIRLEQHTLIRKAIMLVSTFFLTCMAWIVFRANNMGDVAYVVTHIPRGWDFGSIRTPQFLLRQMPVAIAAIVALEIGQLLWQSKFSVSSMLGRLPQPVRWAAYASFVNVGDYVWRLSEDAIHLLPVLGHFLMQFQKISTEDSQMAISGSVVELPRTHREKQPAYMPDADSKRELPQGSWHAVGRIASFFCLIAVLVFGLHAMITSGLRRIKTGEYGASNQMMEGKVNAQIVITGSSRAVGALRPANHSGGDRAQCFQLGAQRFADRYASCSLEGISCA